MKNVILEDLAPYPGENIVAVPLEVDDYMEIGYITHSRLGTGKFGRLYIEALKKYTTNQNE